MKVRAPFSSTEAVRPSSVVALGLALAAVECGGSNQATQSKPASPSTTSSSEPKDDVVRGITNGQLEIAHYASGDGVTGLVLDRSGDATNRKAIFEKVKTRF